MRVFITGATGFIGMAVTQDLVAAGHQVLGLCRSDDKAAALAAAGAEVHKGALEDIDSVKSGAARADAVIHLAFNHDFSTFAQNCEDDRRVITALGSVINGSNRPMLITSGTAIAQAAPGQPSTEDGGIVSSSVVPRAASEEAANALAQGGVNVGAVRLPQVHDTTRAGLITYYVSTAMEKGYLAYIGEGTNRWAAAYVSDVARLYRLAIERGVAGAHYHAVGEEGVSMRAIAETLGKRLGLPVKSITPDEAPAYFGWLAMFAAHDMPASSVWTRRTLNWEPTGPSLVEDLAQFTLEH